MAEDKSKKSPQPDDEKAAKKDDELVINDSTKQDQEKPEPHDDVDSESENKDLSGAPEEPKDGPAAKPAATPAAPKKKFVWTRKKIILAAILALVVLVGVLAAIPTTRYGIAGLFVKRDVAITLHDSKTNKPVSNVAIDIAGGPSTTTDAKGVATFKSLPVGAKKLTIHKKYYKDLSTEQTVGITGGNPTFDFSVEATGRQVPVKVINKVSQQPVEGVDLTADGTSSKTDKNGEATVVLPADKTTVSATLTGQGYNKLSANITVTEQKDDKNTFAVVPSGTLYFLSKRSGTIDVLKSDLDGSNIETVVKGTGQEEDGSTVLLASRDWKYLGLLARRDSDKAKVYIIDTSTDKLATVDEGNAAFSLKGWSGQHLIYEVDRTEQKDWIPKRSALKSYNATSAQLTTLDETNAVGDEHGYAEQDFDSVYILDNLLVYTKTWNGYSSFTSGQHPEIASVRPDGQNKQTVKAFPNEYSLQARAYEPQSIYFRAEHWDGGNPKSDYYEYEDGQIKTADLKDEDFAKFYPTFLISPSGNNTFWYEPRDGKNALFVGDKDGKNGKEIATLSEYTPYGWYGDDYLLVSKGGSELYIISRSNPGTPLKVTDYHKPQVSFYGYGYGYGGF